MEDQRASRILSIQSHVVAGYVGNKSAIFPLQLLGFDVDSVNTVHFSNHTGYRQGWEGERLSAEQFKKIIDGLRRNGLLRQEVILAGYCGNAEVLVEIGDLVRDHRQKGEQLFFVCDPVMGDNGKLYVGLPIVDQYRDNLVPIADLITPNQFELETLTQRTIKSLDEAAEACDVIHDKGVETVIVTSLFLEEGVNMLLGSFRQRGQDKTERFLIRHPQIECYFIGTGDLFSAILVGYIFQAAPKQPAGQPLVALNASIIQSACEKGVGCVHNVLTKTKVWQSTHQHLLGEFPDGELRLVHCRDDIEHPTILFPAEPFVASHNK
eukprot:TRINITY_DN49_c2_g1_i1.p2 TRINITY_DN49_c2_g1~~TRINITY_DN49_c2_g1_i1.p2  ORF type:complete len:346 (-),score=135.36 TRINITY_DN49_c2_g1_i1:39-1007(-)